MTIEIKHVLHVIVGLGVGGAELMLKRLLETHQHSTEYQHSVISLTSLGVIGPQLQSEGIEVNALGMKSAFDMPRILWRLMRIIRCEHPDIVQTWMYHADLLGGLAARMVGVQNVIWGIRTTEVSASGNTATVFVRKLCAILSRFVPRLIICAADASRRAHIAVGYVATKMVVVPNGFDLTRLMATPNERSLLRTHCNVAAENVVIGCLGRFHPAKDQENFVRAAGVVAQRHRDVRFLLVGRDLNAGNEQLVHWINATGYADRFTLLGERSDVPICLAAMDLFCLSSRTEGFPNVVGEAMAMGLPCVVTDVGDAGILVADTGVVVPKEDSSALAFAMEELLALAPETRHQLGQAAKTRIGTEFSMERARQRFEDIYQQVTKKDPT